jgi:hypothetical protein
MLHEFQGRYSQRVKRSLSARGRRMAKARWDRWRANSENRPEPEPKMVRWHRFEYGIRDTVTGETHFRPLVSGRQAAKAIGLILKYCL